MYAVKGKPLHSTRGSRRTFAKKSKIGSLSLAKNYVQRGGGYL